MELTPETAPLLAAKYVDIFQQNFGTTLDFSPSSLEKVDHMLEQFHQEGNSPEEMQGTVAVVSCYIGEVFRRNAGGKWVSGDGENVPDVIRFPLMMKLPGGRYTVPYAKVAKRIQNGNEDSISFYYQVLTQITSTRSFDSKDNVSGATKLRGSGRDGTVSGFLKRLWRRRS